MSALVLLATFLAAGVEWVEALTIVLAVGIYKGWRSALVGTLAAAAGLIALVAVFGTTLTAHVPITLARTVVGVFLLLFGLRWLHKAILRASGLKTLHDETQAFEVTRRRLIAHGGTTTFDWLGATTSFNGVFLEGLEVVFIVIALGGLNGAVSATAGALASLLVVVVMGIALRAPLVRIPENAMKLVVGLMLTSFGTFFAGEGIGVQWWRDDLSVLVLIAVYGLVSIAFVGLLRSQPGLSLGDGNAVRIARAIVKEVWGLFVDDGALAIVAVAVLLAVAVFVDRVAGQHGLAAALLVVGMVVALWVPLSGHLGSGRGAASVTPDAPPTMPAEDTELGLAEQARTR
jgi:uncharacterized membrane protein